MQLALGMDVGRSVFAHRAHPPLIEHSPHSSKIPCGKSAASVCLCMNKYQSQGLLTTRPCPWSFVIDPFAPMKRLQQSCALLVLTVLSVLLMGRPAAAQAPSNADVIVASENVTPPSVEYQGDLPPLIDRQAFFGDPKRAGAQLSPDGEHVSFIKPYRGVMNVWVKGINEPFDAAEPVTADTTRPVRGYFWSQDSERILYQQDKGGNENFHIYAVDPDAEEETDLGVPGTDRIPRRGLSRDPRPTIMCAFQAALWTEALSMAGRTSRSGPARSRWRSVSAPPTGSPATACRRRR